MNMSDFGFSALAGLVIVLLLFLHWRGQRVHNRRQREAEALVLKGQTPAQAAKAANMPWGQRLAFVATMNMIGREGLRRAHSHDDTGIQAPFDVESVRAMRFVLYLVNGDKVYVDGARSVDEALKKGGVHPANLRTHSVVDVAAISTRRNA